MSLCGSRGSEVLSTSGQKNKIAPTETYCTAVWASIGEMRAIHPPLQSVWHLIYQQEWVKGEGCVSWCQPKKRTRDEDFKHSIGNYQIVRFLVFNFFLSLLKQGSLNIALQIPKRYNIYQFLCHQKIIGCRNTTYCNCQKGKQGKYIKKAKPHFIELQHNILAWHQTCLAWN